ncbi:MAG: hypothetical protein EKK64_03505 [Neisseriaceae bacterium]|nr:MAG: hypothetical protein EKK64_03505 [Neisseriaceae bacterium]
MKIEDLKGKNLKTFLSLMETTPLTTISNEEEYELLEMQLSILLNKGKLNKGEELYLFNLTEIISLYDELNPF